jgi:hypothetical protein
VRFLRDAPGAEALGIAYTAAYLRAAPAGGITAEAFDALGGFADRLARRASARQGKADDALLAAHLDVAAWYGVAVKGFERDGRMQLCYDGDAFRRVLAMAATNEQRARAALALTRHECVDPALRPFERQQVDEHRAGVLDGVDAAGLPSVLKNRLRMRQAGVWAGIAFERARRGESGEGAARRALDALAAVDRREWGDGDDAAYADAAVRTAASRWAAEATSNAAPTGRLQLQLRAGEPGESCLTLVEAMRNETRPLLSRCTYGLPWMASARVHAAGHALVLAVQPLAGWRELWVFHRVDGRWKVDVLPAAAGEPALGVIEFAGWVPGGTRLLVAREARVEGRVRRSFEVLRLDTLVVEKRADAPEALSAFARWQDPQWKQQTVLLR